MKQDPVPYDVMVERQEAYFEKVRENGGTPWFEDPAKRQVVADKLSVPVDSDLRRALYDARDPANLKARKSAA